MKNSKKLRYDYKGKWPVAKSDYNYNIDPSPSKTFVMNNKGKKEVTNFYKPAFGAREKWELYDLKKDPHQINNVASNIEYSGILKSLQQKLNEELIKSGDRRESGDGALFEKELKANAAYKRKNK